MKEKSIITRKIKIVAKGDSDERKNKYSELRNISDTLMRIGNELIRYHIFSSYFLELRAKDISKKDKIEELKKHLNTSITNFGYRLTTDYEHIPSDIRTNFNQQVEKMIKNNFYDMTVGKISVPSFTKGNMSFTFTAKDRIKVDSDGDYILSLPTPKSIKNNDFDFILYFGKDKSNNKSIIDKALAGVYKLCNSKIQIIDKDFYLLLTVEIPTNNVSIDKSKVMSEEQEEGQVEGEEGELLEEGEIKESLEKPNGIP